MKKRLFTLFLAICMVCTLLPFGAFAATAYEPTGITIPKKININCNTVTTITPELNPKNATTNLTWTSSNTSVAEVHTAGIGYSGNITGISPGKATVTVRTGNGYSASCTVTVEKAVEPVEINLENSYEISMGEHRYIDPAVIPSDADTLFTISSSNPSVVSTFTGGGGTEVTKNGKTTYFASSVGVIGEAAGSATITIESINGLKSTAIVNVNGGISPSAISIPKNYTIVEGDSWDIPITIEPKNSTTTYSISCKNDGIVRTATTGAGSGCRVYGVAAGSEIVTVYTSNGLSASCNIKVVHELTDKTIHKPTCTEKGYTAYTCSICGCIYKDNYVDALGHSTTLKNAKDATCTAKGYTGDKVCTTCGETIEKGKDIAALGHSWDAGRITTKATCTANGVKTYTCTVCGATKTESIAALGHQIEILNAKESTCLIKGYTGDKVCMRCSETLEEGTRIAALGHSWDAGKVTTKATCTENGVKTYTCAVCGGTKKDSIPALGHSYKDGVCTRCGAKATSNKPVIKNPFVDVAKGSYCYDAVQWAVDKGITKGVDATHFEPGSYCTRGQIVTFLWRANGSPSVKGMKNPFVDVAKGSYCYEAVLWAVKEGITKGFDASHFKPNDTCTRSQAVTFLWRADGQPSYANTKCPFKDVSKGAFYYDAMMWAVSEGITKGTDATHFAPNQICNRGQIVTFLYRDLA